jgi:PBP1b-binding outer membrane lipoprotein LpoB
MKRIAAILLAAVLLAACTADQIGAGAKSWCRNSPDRCTVNE